MRRLRGLAISGVLIVLVVGLAVAGILWQSTYPGTVTVTSSELKAYDTLGNDFTSFSFGSMNQSQSGEVRFQIENVGDFDVYTYAYFNGSSIMDFNIVRVDSWGGTSQGDLNGTLLTVGTTYMFELRATVKSDAPRGDYALELTLYASDQSSGGP